MSLRAHGSCLGVGLMLLLTGPVGRAFGHDFRLYAGKVEEDGFTRDIAYFQNQDRTRVQINLPGGWTVAADAAALTLTSPTASGSLIRLENSRFAPDLPFKDKGLEAYRRQALSTLPEGATDTKMVEEHDNPLPIFHWKTYEFVLAYDFYGSSYQRSVLFLDMDAKEQLVVTALAAKPDHARVRSIALDLLRSWQTLPPN